MIVNNVDNFDQFIVYENAVDCIEIDSRGIRMITKYDTKVINNPEIISIYEEGKNVIIVVDGQEFAKVDNFKKTIYS